VAARPSNPSDTGPASPRPSEVPLFVLAYDHRSVLRQMLAGDRQLAIDDELLRRTKDVVLDGLLAAIDDRLVPPGTRAGLLIDEELGAEAAIRAHEHGIELTMPVERSGASTFTLDYGPAFLDHLRAFPVDYAKILVFLNPAEAEDRYQGQIDAVRDVLGDIATDGYRIMLEVIIPPTRNQLARLGDDQERFDRELRPALVCQAIADCYAAGIRPELWKLEGLETPADYTMVAATVSSADPAARSLVLGRGADARRVVNWVRLAARTPGFSGFAIGRSIWEDALTGWLTGAIDAGTAVRGIARQYAHYVSHYLGARLQAGSDSDLAARD
jgi:myo-inositol catabolism protein IolC